VPLIKYAQYLTFPDGSPAADTAFPVMLLGGNVTVPTFSDKAGTVPLSNPVLTDAEGLLEFYAAPGTYATDVSGNLFQYPVDDLEADDAWPGTFVHEQSVMAQVWTVEHHFGAPPSVDVIVAGSSVEAEVSHPDAETTQITFAVPTAGTALLRR